MSSSSLTILPSPKRLQHHVQWLAGLNPPRSFDHPSSMDKAARYIGQHFSKYSSRVSEQTFHAFGEQYRNIICSYGPQQGPRVIVGAHYDVAGHQPGADDNASGVAGVLELSRLLGEHPPNLTHRVDLVAYALEEPPFFGTESMGSAVHARSLYQQGVTLNVMIALEMVGYFTDEKTQSYPLGLLKWFYPSRGHFIGVVGKWGQGTITKTVRQKMIEGSEIAVHSINAPRLLPGIDLSDHRNFWHYGYPAVMITDTSFYRNPHYHSITDTPDTLDYRRMAEVIKGVFHAIQ